MNKYKVHQKLHTMEIGLCEVVAIYSLQASNLDQNISKYVYLLLDQESRSMFPYLESEITEV